MMNLSISLQCDHCGFRCSKKFILKRHIISCHINKSSHPKSSKCNISCEQCNVLFYSRDDLICHLTTVHNEKIVIKTLNFSSVNDFESWKKGVETENHCRYVQKCGVKKCKKKSVLSKYFYCHRDGNVRFRAPEPRKRRIKSQGSNKINNACPSKIICKIFDSGTIEVTFVSTHNGHDDNIGRLALTEDEKAVIAGKLKIGVPFDEILDTIYNSVNDINSPIALTGKQQLRNIVRDFDLNPWKAHSNNATSVPVPNEIVVQQPVPEEEIDILKPCIESKTVVYDNEYAEKLRTKAETVLGYLTKPKTLSTLSEKEYLELNRVFDRLLNILGKKLPRMKLIKPAEGESANKNIEK